MMDITQRSYPDRAYIHILSIDARHSSGYNSLSSFENHLHKPLYCGPDKKWFMALRALTFDNQLDLDSEAAFEGFVFAIRGQDPQSEYITITHLNDHTPLTVVGIVHGLEEECRKYNKNHLGFGFREGANPEDDKPGIYMEFGDGMFVVNWKLLIGLGFEREELLKYGKIKINGQEKRFIVENEKDVISDPETVPEVLTRVNATGRVRMRSFQSRFI
jgi:hypothetical protein